MKKQQNTLIGITSCGGEFFNPPNGEPCIKFNVVLRLDISGTELDVPIEGKLKRILTDPNSLIPKLSSLTDDRPLPVQDESGKLIEGNYYQASEIELMLKSLFHNTLEIAIKDGLFKFTDMMEKLFKESL